MTTNKTQKTKPLVFVSSLLFSFLFLLLLLFLINIKRYTFSRVDTHTHTHTHIIKPYVPHTSNTNASPLTHTSHTFIHIHT